MTVQRWVGAVRQNLFPAGACRAEVELLALVVLRAGLALGLLAGLPGVVAAADRAVHVGPAETEAQTAAAAEAGRVQGAHGAVIVDRAGAGALGVSLALDSLAAHPTALGVVGAEALRE